MDLSSLNTALNNLQNRITKQLENLPDIGFANYEKQRDVIYVSNKYNEIVEEYSNLLKLITDTQYFVSQCKKINRLLPENSSLEKTQKMKIKSAIELINDLSEPLYNEKERLKTIEMFYRNLYTQKDF